MRAIVYTSNTGSTAKYAKQLSHQICVPSFSMVEAKTKVKPGAEIIYMGWIMAGKIKGYPEAARKYNIQAVCGVGMGQTGTQLVEIRTKNKVPQRIPLFTLQGTFDVKKLHGVYKMMMNVMVKTAGKALADKSDRTPEDDDMLDMMLNGSERVKAENLKHIIDWCLMEPDNRIWYAVWNMELKNVPGTIVGDFCFKGLGKDGVVEIGYGLRKEFRHQGYMVETVKVITECL